ncbi:MAG TPA: ATP synthase F0 subunit B [Candidatus Omnitrophica bacterium]|nr:MAG: ATP synthase F0 subunit B [Omnitrophica WOR_2 bacterium GWA2_45_18]OGX19027.1 MAG: ATP synthase F0 subunit B [Omnitrophica WOR_2 bacterium GWC2_45_7]HBR15774.1 ATP synthase F0 subunit B [Candidatus Omnitrophota bacterium]
MSEIADTIDISTASQAATDPGVLSPDVGMTLLTWVTFFLLLAILNKFAWKPILNRLDQRAEEIKKSLENADRIKEELAAIHQKQAQLIKEAETRAHEIIDQSRKAAVEAANVIRHKAKEETKISLENALREIKDEKEKAQAFLREESARIAVSLAGKLLEQNLDDEKNRRFINQMIKEI